MGTVARLLDEHVSFRCASVDRIGVRGYIPGIQYEGGVVKFLLNRGGTIPSPALLNHNRERLLSELEVLEESTGVPTVRFKAGESKRGPRPAPSRRGGNDRSMGIGARRQGSGTDVGVARLRQRRLSRASHQPSPHGLASPVLGARPLVFLFRRSRVGAGLRQGLLLHALSTVVLRQRTRVGQVPAGQGRDRLRGPRQRAALRRRPRRCAPHLCPSRRRSSPRTPGAHDGRGPRSSLCSSTAPPGSSGPTRSPSSRSPTQRCSTTRAADQAIGQAANGSPSTLGRCREALACSSTARCSAAPGARPQDVSSPRSSPTTPPLSSRSTTNSRRPRPI